VTESDRLCVHDPTTWDVEDGTDALTAVGLCRRCPALTWCTAYTHNLVTAGLPPVLVVQAARVWSKRGDPGGCPRTRCRPPDAANPSARVTAVSGRQ